MRFLCLGVVDRYGLALGARDGGYAMLVCMELYLAAVDSDLGGADVAGSTAAAYAERCAGMAHDGHLLALTLAPVEVYGEVAHSLHASDTASALPYLRQCGEDVDIAMCALHEHLGHTRTYTEVAVDLERGVGVEEVVVDATGTRIDTV